MRALFGRTGWMLALLGTLAFAESNPAAATWKLDKQRSTLNGPPPSIVRNGILKIRPEIYTGEGTAAPRRQARTAGASKVFKFDLSPDGRTLTVTRPNDAIMKMVFERQ